MFQEETLFILGAGASVPYGYPTGAELISAMKRNMDDEIFIPVLTEEHKKSLATNNQPKFNIEFVDNRDFILLSNMEDSMYGLSEDSRNLFYPSGNDPNLTRGSCFTTIKIKEIDSFCELDRALTDFDPISIDSFLKYHTKYEVAGKTMIVYTLLKMEDKKLFGRRGEHSWENYNNMKKNGVMLHSNENWYTCFFNDLISGCEQGPRSITKNKCSIITFNYDLSLDAFLRKRVLEMDFFSDLYSKSSDESIAQNFIRNFNIHHVYGALFDTKYLETEYNHNDYGALYGGKSTLKIDKPIIIGQHAKRTISRNSGNMMQNKLFLKSYKLHRNIETMYDERTGLISENKKEEVKIKIKTFYNMIKEARNIVFIGFGFDRDNLNMLGLPKDISELSSLLQRKTIRWLNYNGSMKGLSKQFSHLMQDETVNKLDRVIITESTESSIYTAYQNDFKIALYENR